MKLQSNKECFFCGRTDSLHHHEVFYGTANRKKSIKWGLQVWLCPEHHNMSSQGVHMNHERDMILKKYAQKVFETEYGRDKFIEIFHKNYLKGDEHGI